MQASTKSNSLQERVLMLGLALMTTGVIYLYTELAIAKAKNLEQDIKIEHLHEAKEKISELILRYHMKPVAKL